MSNSSHFQSRRQSGASSTANTDHSFAVERQASLFAHHAEVLPGSLNDSAVVRAVLVEAIRKCEKSRDQIAEEMSLYTGSDITVRRLNGFTAESAEDYRFPAELDRAFCLATGDYQLLKCRAELAGYHVISETDFQLLKLGREYLRQKRANDNVVMLEKRLAGVEL